MPYFYYATHNEDRQSAFHTQRTQTIAWWIAAIATHKHQFPGVGRSATERERGEKRAKKKKWNSHSQKPDSTTNSMCTHTIYSILNYKFITLCSQFFNFDFLFDRTNPYMYGARLGYAHILIYTHRHVLPARNCTEISYFESTKR